MRIKPVTDEIYHIYNRGVEKRNIFTQEKDYLRFIHDLYEFNDVNPVLNVHFRFNSNKTMGVGLPYIKTKIIRSGNCLVDVLVFCLMPNHFHLMLRQRVDGGITEFMRKIGSGYTNYFNKKYERVGPLFQGKYKHIIIKHDAQFIHLPYYIHLNPLDLFVPEWREKKLSNQSAAIKFLENYRWSSFLDYAGKKNFPSVTKRDFLLKFFDGSKAFKENILTWLKELDIDSIRNITLEN